MKKIIFCIIILLVACSSSKKFTYEYEDMSFNEIEIALDEKHNKLPFTFYDTIQTDTSTIYKITNNLFYIISK